MEELRYNEICWNQVTILKDEPDYEVRLNNVCIMTTGDDTEAYMVAESLDVALSILNSQGLLKENS